MRTRSIVTLVVVFTLAVGGALAFAAPLAGARRAPSSAHAAPDPAETTSGASPSADTSITHDDTPRQTERRTGDRVMSKQQAGDHADAPALRFATITVTIDPRGIPLAAYQFEITAGHAFTVVGLDNAGHPSFSDPPRYDRAAAAEGTDRLIVADYTTRPIGQLVAKPQRVATIHAAFTVAPGHDAEALAASVALTLTAAADAEGSRIDADITYELHLAERPGQE